MQQNHAKAIKGLCIATIILSALGIIVCLIGAIGMTMLAPLISSYSSSVPYSTYDSYGDFYYFDDYDYYMDYSYSDPFVAQIVSMFAGGLFIFALLCAVVTLIAGIIGLRNADNGPKLGLVFGWSIAGAIVGFIGTGIVIAVLMIIVAVFAYKDKQLYQSGAYGAPIPYGTVTYDSTNAANAQVPPTNQTYAPYANAYGQTTDATQQNAMPVQQEQTGYTTIETDQPITLVQDGIPMDTVTPAAAVADAATITETAIVSKDAASPTITLEAAEVEVSEPEAMVTAVSNEVCEDSSALIADGEDDHKVCSPSSTPVQDATLTEETKEQ